MNCDNWKSENKYSKSQVADYRLQVTDYRLQIADRQLISGIRRFKFILFLILAISITGCASGKIAKKPSEVPEKAVSEPKQITSMNIESTPDAIHVLVKGNRLLTYTSVKQPDPLAVILYFSETRLGTVQDPEFLDNAVIRSVKASELTEDGKPGTTRIEISLKKDIPYEVTREDTGVKISFAASSETDLTRSSHIEEKELGTYDAQHTASSPDPSMQTATQVQTVYATKLDDSLKVFVGADGMITNYKSFTSENPPGIIFDIFNVKSPYKNEKIVSVDTHWVRQVRYYGYPDRLRVVLDTEQKYLTAFSAYPVDNGLLIHVGRPGSVLSVSGRPGMVSSDSATQKPEPVSFKRVKRNFPGSSATRLQAVYATQFKDGIIVTVRGNGAVTDYAASVIENPPTIVFDVFDIRGNHKADHAFPVDTRWVKQVRHESHPDRLRVFIETTNQYLSAFSASPNRNGLEIYVGGAHTGITTAQQSRSSQSRSDTSLPQISDQPRTGSPSYTPAPGSRTPAPESDYSQPAWVEHTDFVSEGGKKSKLVVRTTRPVQYDINRIEDRKLEFRLFNTQIPAHRQGKLIDKDTYFESAVEQITPVYNQKNTTLFSIDMLEDVPYSVEQRDDLLAVHFEAPIISVSETAAKPSVPASVEIPVKDASERAGAEKTDIAKRPSASIPEFKSPTQQPSGQSDTFRLPSRPSPISGTVSSGTDSTSLIEDETLVFEEPKKKYTGEKIALDFFETDVKNVFRILKEVSGKNFAIDNDVRGKVTLSLEHPVPWDQVLDLVLKMNQLGRTMEGDIIRIATIGTIQKEEKLKQEKILAEQTLREKQKELEQLFTEYIAINYSDANAEIKPHLDQILTKDRGTLSVDKRTNMIIMTDTREKLRQARDIVRKLDRVTPQVIIEARVIEATNNFSRDIGTSWGAQIGVQSGDANAGVGPQRGYDMLGGTYGYDLAMNLPVPDLSIGFNFARLVGSPLLLDAKIGAMESTGNAKIISAPKVMTLDNKKAKIKQGISYPYKTYQDGTWGTTFKEIDLLLEVTPHVTADNRISLRITITKNDLGTVISGEQSFTTKEAETELLVNDGDTVVIGGIIKETNTQSAEGVPYLRAIPILGWLFKSTTKRDDRDELLIFITPKIVQLEQRVTQY